MSERTPLLGKQSQGFSNPGYTDTTGSYSAIAIPQDGREARQDGREARQLTASPFTEAAEGPHAFCVSGVSYTVQEQTRKWWQSGCCTGSDKRVLHDINAVFRSGQVAAILGNSGSGKTSLLDVIAQRTSGGNATGKTYLNGTPMTSSRVKLVTSYVMQDDRLLQTLSVRETLMYTARLKFAGVSSREDDFVKNRVESVIQDMGLRSVADSRVGGVVDKTLSGGEKRRVSVAQQLLQDPVILLLDEPTTGLDSFTAHHLVASLKTLAQRGKVVIMTIHQPRSDIFELLDQVMFLSLGEMTYSGPRDQLVSYFSDRGHPCPSYANPLDHYMDVVSIDRRTTERERETCARIRHLVNLFKESDQHRETMTDIENIKSSGPNRRGFKGRKRNWCAAIILQVWALYSRLMLATVRDRAALVIRTIQMAFFAVIFWVFLGHLGTDQRSVQDRTGVLFQCIGVPGFLGMMNAIGLFPPHRDLFYREVRDGLYSPPLFLISYVFYLVPLNLINTMCFSAVMYWAVGLYDDTERFFVFCLCIYCATYTGEMLGLLIMGFIYNVNIANAITSMLVTTTSLIASGFLRSIASLPDVMGWLTWAMVPKYASETLVYNEYHDLKLSCPPANMTCEYPSGDIYVEKHYPGAEDHQIRNYIAMPAYCAALSLLAVVVFSIKSKRNLR